MTLESHFDTCQDENGSEIKDFGVLMARNINFCEVILLLVASSVKC